MNVDPSRRLLQAAALVVLFGVALRCAWLGDDAYITLRTVENAVAGDGLRWNPAIACRRTRIRCGCCC